MNDKKQPQPNAANPDQLRDQQIRDKHKERTNTNDLGFIMSDPRGRRWMMWLMDQCGMDKISFTGNSETFFREGARNVGLMLKTRIDEISPDLYITMLQEQIERSKKNG